jgi:hypothetical protein
MNNFNTVHAAIRKRCPHANVQSEDCLDHIKEVLDEVYHVHIDFYLSFLQDLGLIKYEDGGRKITITERGKATEKIFKE